VSVLSTAGVMPPSLSLGSTMADDRPILRILLASVLRDPAFRKIWDMGHYSGLHYSCVPPE